MATHDTAASSMTLDRAGIEQQLAQSVHHFIECAFDGEDLARLDLQGCTFERCTFAETSLFASKLARSTWRRCRAGSADFESVDAVDATFEGCDLNNTKWRRAKLASVTYRGCKLTGASFEEVAHLGLTFEDSLLVGADLRGFSFRKAILKQLDFPMPIWPDATSATPSSKGAACATPPSNWQSSRARTCAAPISTVSN